MFATAKPTPPLTAGKVGQRGERPSALLAALVVVVGGLLWCWGTWLFEQPWPVTVGTEERLSPLARLILFAAVGTILLVAGLRGLWRCSRQPREETEE